MEPALLKLLGGKREIDRGDYTLRLLTARELLMARAEAKEMQEGEETAGLCAGACILARAVTVHGARAFSGGKMVLETWSAEKIGEEMAAYRAMADQEDPRCGQQASMEQIMAQLSAEPMERIRWRVLRAFSALPTEQRVRDMTEGDYLYCAAQMLLDQQESMERLCPSCQQAAEKHCCPGCGKPVMNETEKNPQFDLARFEELRRHG